MTSRVKHRPRYANRTADWTPDDYAVAQLRAARDPVTVRLVYRRGIQGDLRDADVMLFLERYRKNGAPRTLIRFGQLFGFVGEFVRLPYGQELDC